LLTFFYRQMREIIERGYLYIAQPPLYRVKRHSQEIYLKNNQALEQYLIEAGTQNMTLEFGAGANFRGAVLQQKVLDAVRLRHAATDAVRLVGHAGIIEQALLAGAFAEGQNLATVATALAQRLNRFEVAEGQRWQVEATPEGLAITMLQKGLKEAYAVPQSLLSKPELRNLIKHAASLDGEYPEAAVLRIEANEALPLKGPFMLADVVLQQGRHGLNIQRYKGLGEMNPDQLWETTLDPTRRSLLQVRVDHADEADGIFSTLMGDVVEPRREFIQENALKVGNLDA
jgi:DNA gyrase subunit B